MRAERKQRALQATERTWILLNELRRHWKVLGRGLTGDLIYILEGSLQLSREKIERNRLE